MDTDHPTQPTNGWACAAVSSYGPPIKPCPPLHSPWLAGRLSRRDGGGWGVGGCWSLYVPRCARLLPSPPLFPVPTPPTYSPSPTHRGVGPSCVGWPSPSSSCAQHSKYVSARDICILFYALFVMYMIRAYLTIKCLSSNPSMNTSLHVNSCHTILTVKVP